MPLAFVLFMVLLAAGYVAGRTGRFPDNASDTLNRFVIDVCVPALVLRLVPTLALRWELATLVLMPWSMALLAYVCVRLGGGLFGWDPRTRAALFMCTAFGNTSFLGFPMCEALLGADSIPLAVVYDQLGSFLLLTTVGTLSVARASGGSHPPALEMARRIVTFPPFVALLLALLPLPHPAWLDALLTQVSSALVPCAVFAVGLRTRITPPPERTAFAFGLALKLAVMPLAAWGLARALGASPAILEVAVLESAMPAMISAGALAMMAGLAPQLAAALVGWGIVISLVTLRVWASLVHS